MKRQIDITVRRATSEDADALLPLVQAYRVFYEQEPDSQHEREYVERHLRRNTSAIYIAETGGAICGFMQLFKTYSTVYVSSCWILEDLFVASEFRRIGVAGALLSRALQHARDDGACGMFLETGHANLAAQALYEKSGWVREGRFVKYNAPLPSLPSPA